MDSREEGPRACTFRAVNAPFPRGGSGLFGAAVLGVVVVLATIEARAHAAGAPAAAVAARFVKGPYTQHVTESTAEVRVELDVAAPLTLEVGGADGGTRKIVVPKASTFHIVSIPGLVPSTVYELTATSAGARATFGFTTAPPRASSAPFRYLVYGDNRTDDPSHAAVVKQMVAASPDFLLHTGDYVEDGGNAKDWQTFFDIERPLLSRACLYGTVGNHELVDKDATYFLKYFALGQGTAIDGGSSAGPQLSGTIRWGNSRFFLFNAMAKYTAGRDREWLERELVASDAEEGIVWRVLVVHHGIWSSGPHGDNQAFLDAKLPALFREHHVDLVFAGHDHIYERGIEDGLAYVVTGGGGAPTYELAKPRPMVRKAEASRHFVEVTSSPESLAMVTRRVDGSILERCNLLKNKGWDCDSVKPLVAPQPSIPPSRSCVCDAVGARPHDGAGVPGGFVFLGALAIAGLRRGRRGETS